MAKDTKKDPPGTIPHGVPIKFGRTAEDYAQMIGGVVWASNYLHGSFFYLFDDLLLPTHSGPSARALWLSYATGDLPARLATRALAASRIKAEAGIFLDIDWSIKVANRLGEFRNDFVHTPVDFDSGTASVVPDRFAATEARKKKLARPDIREIAFAVKDDAFRLSCFVWRLALEVRKPEIKPLEPPLPQAPGLVGDDPKGLIPPDSTARRNLRLSFQKEPEEKK
jgi:hypothetical protein